MKKMIVEVELVADQVTVNAIVFSADALRKLHDGITRFWDEDKRTLTIRGEIDAESVPDAIEYTSIGFKPL